MSVLDSLPDRVRIVEVAPRDGLQNEARHVPAARKIRFIRELLAAGVEHLEVTSFVRPDRVPQLADAAEVLEATRELEEARDARLTVLVPNEKGLERAIEAGARSVAFITATSETFNRRNQGVGVEESLERLEPLLARARAASLETRVYLSTAFSCPYEGEISKDVTVSLLARLRGLDPGTISVGDTTGQAHPLQVDRLLEQVKRHPDLELDSLALHLHDTRGFALASLLVGLRHGIREFDTSAGGLGGCPYAPGASGNLATETAVDFLHAMGVETGLDLEKLRLAARSLRKDLEATAEPD